MPNGHRAGPPGPVSLAVPGAQRPGAEGAKSRDTASLDLSTTQSARKQPQVAGAPDQLWQGPALQVSTRVPSAMNRVATVSTSG